MTPHFKTSLGTLDLIIAVAVPLSVLEPSCNLALAQTTKAETLSVVGSRPLAMAVDLLEDRYGWHRTYEDPPYSHTSDVTDQSAPQLRGKSHPGYAPAMGQIEIAYNVSVTTRGPDDPVGVIQRLLDDHASRNNPGKFRLLQGRLQQGSQVFHVVPSRMKNDRGDWVEVVPILDLPVTFPLQDRTVMETLEVFCTALARAAGTRVMLGIYPTNLLYQHRSSQGANNGTARSVLLRITEATNRKLSWRVFYDPGWKSYALSLRILTQVVPNRFGGTTRREVR